ncbi:MAG: hypothetical protein IKD70_07310 [Eggerthellaceae bacterium]|nr:hypothetical protein [Eggerthellaceae bacterium]
MDVLEFGDPEAATVLIQPVDDHDLSFLDNEVAAIRHLTARDFRLLAVKVDSWNADLSPWEAPAVFGNESFGGGAEATLEEVLELCADPAKLYCIGGYSLAGLFALWAAYRTDVFAGVAAASPSVWFPHFTAFMGANEPRCRAAYLSLGDREERTRNPVMTTVGDGIREAHTLLQARGVPCTLEWNPGNHFKDPDLRTAKGFAWLLEAL